MKCEFLLAAAIVLLPHALPAQRNCTKGKPCGNTCIAQNRVCRIGSSPATPAPSTGSTARGLLGGAPATGSAPAAPVGALSYCTSGLESSRDLLLVGDARPGLIIGRDQEDGSPFYSPSARDTLLAQLLSIHCPAADQVRLYVLLDRRRVMLDGWAIPKRSAAGEDVFSGNVRVRQGGAVRQAYVWLDALGVATLRVVQGP